MNMFTRKILPPQGQAVKMPGFPFVLEPDDACSAGMLKPSCLLMSLLHWVGGTGFAQQNAERI